MDGGLRSGEDIAKALAAGASFTMLGRPFLLASAATGPEGPPRFATTLSEELGTTLAQLELTSIAELDDRIFREAGRAPRQR